MNEKIVLAVICGSDREGRQSIKAARWVAEQAEQRGDVDVIFVDPQEIKAEPGKSNPKFSDITKRAQAFYVVTPEYNHSFPGVLKNLLDSELDNYRHKPVASAGVSAGPWGGVRVCEALLPVYHRLGLVPVKPELYFADITDLFDAEGNMKPEQVEMHVKAVADVLDELVWFARKLK